MDIKRLLLVFLFIGSMTLNHCGGFTKPVRIKQEYSLDTTSHESDSINRILVIQPQIKHLDLRTEQVLSEPDYIQSIQNALTENVLDQLHHNKNRIVLVDTSTKIQEDLDELINQDEEGIKEILHVVSEKNTACDGVCLLFMKVKATKEAPSNWTIWSGRIDPYQSTSFLTAYLIHCISGEIVWKNQVFLRRKADTYQIRSLIKVLLSTFPN